MPKRGHSNVHPETTRRWPADREFPERDFAQIELVGGATVYTVKDLPPLALHREEWEEIGRRMGWRTAAAYMLRRLAEKVRRANVIQHSGGELLPDDWAELHMLENEAFALLDGKEDANVTTR